MQLSQQQIDVINWAKSQTGSMILEARAGCGKTTTLLELVKHLPGETFIGAYNKSIAEELKAKLAAAGITFPAATAGTLHSAGFQAWRKVATNVKTDAKKVWTITGNILKEAAKKGEDCDLESMETFVVKAVSLAKQQAFGVVVPFEDKSHWFDLVEHFGLEEELADGASIEDGIDWAIKVYRMSLDMDREVIDFDDMILAPLVHKAKIWQKDWVLLDEAQDTNPARRALAFAMLKPKTGRLVAVGDPAQAIYGFTGASHDSLEQIQEQMGAIKLPLNVTYRCPKSIVALANTWVKDIVAHPTAPQGSVRTTYLSTDPGMPSFWEEKFTAKDAVLCRNTKPLVELAYSFIRRSIACRVEGRDIGQGLLKLARKWKVNTLNAVENNLNAWMEKEIQKWMAKGREEMAASVEDRVTTILLIIDNLRAEGKTNLQDLVDFIQGLFGDTQDGQQQPCLTLSTVHKSKGREWDRVFLLGRNKYMPSKYAKKAWQRTQEDNLQYVAVTRAKKELVEVICE